MASDEILNIHAQVAFPELERYPLIKDSIRTVVEDLVNDCLEPAVLFVNELIENEKAFVNTARHDFRGAAVLWEKKIKDAVPQKKSKDQLEGEYAKQLVDFSSRYFELVRTQIVDIIPKAIIMMLVDASTKNLMDTLNRKIFANHQLTEMMKEDPRITSNRHKCQEVLNALYDARNILSQVRAFSF